MGIFKICCIGKYLNDCVYYKNILIVTGEYWNH